jgi:hypothetical protein
MALLDFIRPKWKHSDPDIRMKAVAEMAEDALDQLKTIAATDLDDRVRMGAIEKLHDKNILKYLAKDAQSPEVQMAVGRQLNAVYRREIFQAESRDQRLSTLDCIDDEEMLFDIACEIDDPHVRLAASKRVHDPSLLCRITASHCGLMTGMAIVERLSEPFHLEQVVREASNKKVKRQAKQKLADLVKKTDVSGDGVPVPAEDALMEQLCREMASLTDVRDAGVRDRMAAAQAAWDERDPHHDHPFYPRFDAVQQRQEARLEKEARETRLRAELDSICRTAEALAKAPLPDGKERLENLKNRLQRLGENPSGLNPSFQDRFDRACRRFEKQLEQEMRENAMKEEALDQLSALCREAEEISKKGPCPQADDKWAELQHRRHAVTLDAPEARPLESRFDRALALYTRKREEQRSAALAQKAADEARLTALCTRVESAVSAEDRPGLDATVKDAQNEWKTAGEAVPEVKAALAPRFQDACDRFFIRQREYWENLDWERWANLNRKEDICLAVEILNREGVTGGAPQIVREARKKWRDIGPVSKERSEEIWTRFNDACDRVHQRCLEEKNELHRQLTTLIRPFAESEAPPSEMEGNWTETADGVKALHARWNAVGPLPVSMEKDLKRQFQETCNAFFDRLRQLYQERDEERQRNAAMKTRLTETSESLADSEDWRETARRMRDLQRQWKEIGPADRNVEDELWARFRTACNTFFDRMKAMAPLNLDRKERLCEEAEALARQDYAEEDMARLSREFMALQKEWKEIGPVPTECAGAILARFRTPCDRFFARRNAWLKARQADYEDHEKRKHELILQAEALSDQTAWKETAEKIKGLQREWKNIGPTSPKTERELWRRFKDACDHFFSRRKQFFKDQDQNRRENLRQKEYLCLSLDALARLVLPAGTIENEQTDDAAEQLRIALELKDAVVVPGNPKTTWDRAMRMVRDIQNQWKEIGPVPGDRDADLWKRFRGAADMFFAHPPDTGKPGPHREEPNDGR